MSAAGRSVVLEHGALYTPPRSPVIVDVPPIVYLMVDGTGAPGLSLAWAEALDALRAAELAVLDDLAAQAGRPDLRPAKPAPLEVLWHPDGEQWTAMVAVPADSRRRAPAEPGAVPVRRDRLHERWAAQLLHVGGGARDAALRRLDRFIDVQGYRAVGPLHEILLDDLGAGPGGTRRRCILRRTVRHR